MSDNPESDKPTNNIPDDEVTVFGGEIDDDWGEAFAADDFMATPDEDLGSEFFLEEDEPEDTPSTGDSEPSTPDSDTDATPRPSLVSQLLLIFSNIFATCKNRILSLPLKFRIAALVVPLLAISVSIYLLTSSTTVPISEPAIVNETAQTAPPLEKSADQISFEKPTEVIPPKVTASDGRIRKKWPLPPFLISTNDNMKGDDVFFVEVEITLILLIEEDGSLPADKAVIIRDIIYQFFNNRPLYELRRFSLARSEMNRKLFSWLGKQWHHEQISTIVFNRYRVL